MGYDRFKAASYGGSQVGSQHVVNGVYIWMQWVRLLYLPDDDLAAITVMPAS
jgi:hypothetical protein